MKIGSRYAHHMTSHHVFTLSGLFYKGDNILNVRRLIHRVVLTQIRKNYYLVADLSE